MKVNYGVEVRVEVEEGRYITADEYMLNNISLAFQEASEKLRREGCVIMANEFFRYSDLIYRTLLALGVYDN